MNKVRFFASVAFAVAEAVLLALILYGADNTAQLCYTAVVLAALFSVAFIYPTGKTALITLGLCFTVVADYFLVIRRPTDNTLGVFFFCFTQLSYYAFLMLSEKRKRMRIINTVSRCALIALAETVALILLGDKADALSLMSVFYISNLAANIAFSFALGKRGLVLAIGLCFFIMCDLFVGFTGAIGVYFDVDSQSWLYKIVFSDFNFIWFFYAPSQALISISSVICGKNGLREKF